MRFNLFGRKKDQTPAPRVPMPQLVPSELLLKFGSGATHTPDLWKLKMQKAHLLFCADETMTKHRCNSMVCPPNKGPICVASSNKPFTMFTSKRGQMTLPIILPLNSAEFTGPFRRAQYAPVKGELHLVTTEQLIALDFWKLNGVAFRRERIYLDIPYRQVQEQKMSEVVRPAMPGLDSQGSSQLIESTYHVLSEWMHFRVQDAWTYIGVPEFHNWDRTLQYVPPTIPADRNLRPYFEFKDDIL